MSAKIINPPAIHEPHGYAHVSIVDGPSRIIHTAGQIGVEKDGTTPATLAGQCKVMLQNLGACLAAAGASPQDVISANIYVVNYDPNDTTVGTLVGEFFADEKGPHDVPGTLVPVMALAEPGLLIEMNVAASVPCRPSPPCPPLGDVEAEVDVIVVGAGLSGLMAATEVQAKGLSCLVLEARDRVGGKTWSKPIQPGESARECGAAWMNNNTQPKIYGLSKKFGLETIVQYHDGKDVVAERSGSIHANEATGLDLVPTEGDASFGQIVKHIDAVAASIDIYNIKSGNADFQDMALSEWLDQNGCKEGTAAWDSLRIFVACIFGVEPREISALYFLDYVKSGFGMDSLSADEAQGAQYLRLRQGNQTISVRLMENLKRGSVRLNCPVQAIEQLGNNSNIVTTYGGRKFRAQKVIVSIPTPLYRTIAFSPPLPADKDEYAKSTFLGDYAKLTLSYKEPWWRKIGLTGGFCDVRGPVTFSRDTSSEQDDQFSLTCFIVGDDCRAWSKRSKTDRQNMVVELVARLSGDAGRESALNYTSADETIWMAEPWSLGAPVPCPGPGTWARLGDALREPFRNIHFVGTETAFLWKGYMEGAVTSGERGAWEVVDALKGKSKL